MTLAYLMGSRNKDLQQVKDILDSCITNNITTYIVYDIIEGRNSNGLEWSSIISHYTNCNFVRPSELPKTLNYILFTTPYMVSSKVKQFINIIKKYHKKGTKTLYLPYDLSTSKTIDLKFENNSRYNSFGNFIKYIDRLYVYDAETHSMLTKHIDKSKLKLIGCPRFNGKANIYDIKPNYIFYNPRYFNNVNKENGDGTITKITDVLKIFLDLHYEYPEKNYKFVIRFHPEVYHDIPKTSLFIESLLSKYKDVFIIDNNYSVDTRYWLEKCSCAISEYSSYNIDIIRQRIPCAQISGYDDMMDIYKDCYDNIDIKNLKEWILNSEDNIDKHNNREYYISLWDLEKNNANTFVWELLNNV